jgi:hypothetical protein
VFRKVCQFTAGSCRHSRPTAFEQPPALVSEPIALVPDGLVEFTLEQLFGQHLDPVGGDPVAAW